MDTDAKDLRMQRLAPGGWRPFLFSIGAHRYSSVVSNFPALFQLRNPG